MTNSKLVPKNTNFSKKYKNFQKNLNFPKKKKLTKKPFDKKPNFGLFWLFFGNLAFWAFF
jgi:hypothetical protein